MYKHRPNKVPWDTKKGWFCLEETKRLQERGDTGGVVWPGSLVEEEKLLLYPLTFSGWGLWIKVTKDRLTREKVYFICTRRGPHRKDMWAYIPFKQRSINCGEMTRQRKTGLIFLGTVNCGKGNIWGKPMEGKGYLVRFISKTQVCITNLTKSYKNLKLNIKNEI